MTEEEIQKLQKEYEDLKAKHETVTRQYKGSTDEAMRLKGELDEARAALEDAKRRSSGSGDFNESFQEILGKDGAEKVANLLSSVVKPLAEKVDSLLGNEAKRLFDRFRNDHPGLTGDLVGAFDQKLKAIKSAYSDIESAMNDAYMLIGGAEADRKAKEDAEAKRKAASDNQRIHEESGSDGAGDRNSGNVNVTLEELTKQLEALQSQNAVNAASGHEDAALIAKMRVLQKKIASMRKTS